MTLRPKLNLHAQAATSDIRAPALWSAFALATALALPGVAFGQTPASPDGTRPGHVAGVGDSLPYSTKSSNTTAANVGSTVAPTLPSPGLNAGASARDYAEAARTSLRAGKTGEAQQALEMAETRMLNRAMQNPSSPPPGAVAMVRELRAARQAIGANNTAEAMRILDTVLSS
jgi:hypothetical protein